MERNTAEKVQAKNGDAQAVHLTILRTEPGVFNDPSGSDLQPGYSVGHEFVKDLLHDWILNCCLALGLLSEDLKQLYRTSSRFLQAACIDQRHRDAVVSSDQDISYMRELAWLRATGPYLEAIGANCGISLVFWMKTSRELCNGYGIAFLLHKRRRW